MAKNPISMRCRFIKLVFLATILVNAGACSLYSDYAASRPANVMELEARLVRAGFQRVPIETPEQNGAVAELPLYRLNRYSSAAGSVFWYADPTVCSCLYEGDQRAYETYADILQQEHDTAEYINDVQPEQVGYLSSFGHAFPPPLLFGGWPAMIHHGGPFHSAGGSGSVGSGVTSKGSGGHQGGGGIHSRGGGGHHGGGIRGHH